MIKLVRHDPSGMDIYQLSNDKLQVVVSNYGGTILNLYAPDRHGEFADVVLGYDKLTSYQQEDGYLGALVGRVANRIKQGTFTLNGKTYHLAVNNGPNHLHGGLKGFSYQFFEATIVDETTLRLHYVSEDGEEGYPGRLDLVADYILKDHQLILHYRATTTEDTLVNITNHSYFNLSGHQESIHSHWLMVKADQFACVDGDGLPTGKIRDVTGSVFDLREARLLGQVLNQSDEQLEIAHGLDHPFILSAKENQVVLYHPESGRQLTVSTSLPTAQIYSANYLNDRQGKNGAIYANQDAVCIETQYLPDAIHLQEHPDTILRKGDVYDAVTSYTFEVITK